MDLEQKVGQMLVFGWQGETREQNQGVSDHTRALLIEMRVGGIVYFGRNLSDPVQAARLNNELQSIAETPLFIMVDQEGGWIARIREPATVFPGNMALGATWSPKLVYKCNLAIGRELIAMGFNTDLAPCIDVNSNPDNPIIGVRSYGDTPAMVGVMGAQAIKGLQAAGMLACGKHFPGHGDTAFDTHKQLPTVSMDRGRMEEVELRPFRIAFENGVDMVMTSHIIFPSVDSELPATLSRKVLTGLLRKELGFKGLIATDCLEMSAITHSFDLETTAVLAVKAGVDLLFVSHTLVAQRRIREAVLAAVRSGEISEKRIDESVKRIMSAKKRIGVLERRAVDVDSVMKVVGCEDHRRLEAEISRRSVTVVRDEGELLPLALEVDEPIFVLGSHKATLVLADEIGKRRKVLGAEALVEKHRDTVCVVVTTPGRDCRPVVKRALDFSKRVILVGVEEPYEAGVFTQAGTFIAAYGTQRCSLAAVAGLLFGEFKPEGRLPVHIPDRSSEDWARAEMDRTKIPE